MSTEVRYIVIGRMATQEIKDEYVAWLKGGHVQAVIAEGATRCDVTSEAEADGGGVRCLCILFVSQPDKAG